MKKIPIVKTDHVLLKYILKVIITAILSLLLFTYIFSKIAYKLDLDLSENLTISLLICVLCAAVTGFISVLGFKNSGVLLGAIAQIPLLFYSLLNVIFNENTWVFFIIKFFLMTLVGMLFGLLAARKSAGFKLKI